MISKQTFIESITFIQKQQTKEDALHDALYSICPDISGDFIFAEYETQFIELLRHAMELPEDNEDLEYFIYELDFGKNYKPGMITEDGKAIDFSSAGAVYDYIVGRRDECKH